MIDAIFGPRLLTSKGDSWTAICRGAVLSVISDAVSVTSRVSRASYGITFAAKFDPDKGHLEKDKRFCTRECHYKAVDQMQWFLTRVRLETFRTAPGPRPLRYLMLTARHGSNTYETDPIEVNFYRCYLPHEGWTGLYKMDEIICINEDPTPPPRKEDSVRQLCRIAFVCPVKFEELESKINDRGEVLRIFRFQVRMTSYGSSVEFEILYDGKSLGEQKVDVQFEDHQPPLPLSLSGIDLSVTPKPHYALGLGGRPFSTASRSLRFPHSPGGLADRENEDRPRGPVWPGKQDASAAGSRLPTGHRRQPW